MSMRTHACIRNECRRTQASIRTELRRTHANTRTVSEQFRKTHAISDTLRRKADAGIRIV